KGDSMVLRHVVHSGSTVNREEGSKVFVLGLDGATRLILGPLMDSGDLPNLRALAQAGAQGGLPPTIPPTNPVVWATFAPGKNPGKHGVYDFSEYSHDPLGGRVNSSRAIESETIWQIAARAGRRSVVAGVALTYPPRPAAGLQLPDFLSPPRVPD